MQEWMRKHRRIIMFFILVFIGVPMVIFFGMPRGQQGPGDIQDNVIAQVGNVPITEAEFRQRLDALAAQRAHPERGRPSYRDLDADGSVQRVIEQLVDTALIKMREQERSLDVENALLADQMKEWEWFQDEHGNFNRDAWNEWVASVRDWDDIYDELREAVSRQVFMGAVTAPAGRVLQRKVDEELMLEKTRLRVRHANVSLALDLSEEEIQAHYEENPDDYRERSTYLAEFIAIPIMPEVPELAWELIERARDGEDFEALATEYSDLQQPVGGTMGWRREGDFVSPHLRPFFALELGDVSEPVLGPDGFHIYTVEDERFNESAEQWEVRGRQIVLHAELDEETLAEREQLADEISARLQEADDPEAIAEEYGFELLQTDYYNRWVLEIDNIHHDDMYRFRGRSLDEDYPPWEPIKARRHIYLANVVDTKLGDLKPIDEVRDEIIESITNERRRTEEYQAELETHIEAIEGQVDSLDNITALNPALAVEIGETEELFSRRDSLFQQQIYVQTRDVINLLQDKEVGDVAGPLSGFLGGYWFFELLERDAPTPEELADMQEEREEMKERFIQTAQFEMMSDFTQDLRERMMASVSFTQDTAAFDRILGRDWDEETPDDVPTDEAMGDSLFDIDMSDLETDTTITIDGDVPDTDVSDDVLPLPAPQEPEDATDAEPLVFDTETDN